MATPDDLTEGARWILEHVDPETEEGKLAIDYAAATQELAPITTDLTQRCANCQLGPIGCCNVWTLPERGMPEALVRLQRIEAKRRVDWQERDPRDRCKYHEPMHGCSLRLFRPPVCFAFYCEPIREALVEERGDSAAQFYATSQTYHEGPSVKADAATLLQNMRAAIDAGKKVPPPRRLPLIDDET